MKKILPICKPIITHSPPIANLFSILGVNENTKSWIMNNYIGIFIKNGGVFDNFYDRNMFFYGCPWTQVYLGISGLCRYTSMLLKTTTFSFRTIFLQKYQ